MEKEGDEKKAGITQENCNKLFTLLPALALFEQAGDWRVGEGEFAEKEKDQQ